MLNDEKNGRLYEEYKKLAEKEENIIFGGRLGEYKYYDKDAVIAASLDMCEKELQSLGFEKKQEGGYDGYNINYYGSGDWFQIWRRD